MSEHKKFSSSFSCEKEDESFDKKDVKHGTEVINAKVKKRKIGTKARSLRYLGTDLDNLSQSEDRIRGADNQFKRNQLGRGAGGAVISENNANDIGQYKQSSRFKSSFSSNEIKADNVDNCSVWSENISVVLL